MASYGEQRYLAWRQWLIMAIAIYRQAAMWRENGIENNEKRGCGEAAWRK